MKYRRGRVPTGLLTPIYICAALLSYTYSRIMVRVSQKATHAIRRDLFAKMQNLPLSYFDSIISSI